MINKNKHKHGEIGLILVFFSIVCDSIGINIPIWISMIISVTAIFLLASAIKQYWSESRN
jgi:hypothetical protein